jgi:hypothetical protein
MISVLFKSSRAAVSPAGPAPMIMAFLPGIGDLKFEIGNLKFDD